MNPARALGPALVLGEGRAWWGYLVGPMAGSVIAVGIAYLLKIPGGYLLPHVCDGPWMIPPA